MQLSSRIYVAGHRGLAGGAIIRALKSRGFTNVITATRQEVDLRSEAAVTRFFGTREPEYVFLCAAEVGGIMAHVNHPVKFLLDNLRIQNNVISAAANFGTEKLLFLGSACAYPKHAPVPIKESYLLDGPLEPSNKGYALAKISGIQLCQAYREEHKKNFIACMPTNLYGIGDTYDKIKSHVIPGMMRNVFLEMKKGSPDVTFWGSGKPTREFLFSEDLADACIFLMERYDSGELINVGSQVEDTLKHIADVICLTLGFTGDIRWDENYPDGTPRRTLDCSKLFGLGWKPKTDLATGLRETYRDFLKWYDENRIA